MVRVAAMNSEGYGAVSLTTPAGEIPRTVPSQIASIIGTVLKQNQSYESYIIKFGQFWFEFFEILNLYNVYQASWFLLILLFLVSSTSLLSLIHI